MLILGPQIKPHTTTKIEGLKTLGSNRTTSTVTHNLKNRELQTVQIPLNLHTPACQWVQTSGILKVRLSSKKK